MIFIWRGLPFLTQSFEYDFKSLIHPNSLKIISMHQVMYADASEQYCCYGRSGNIYIYILNYMTNPYPCICVTMMYLVLESQQLPQAT